MSIQHRPPWRKYMDLLIFVAILGVWLLLQLVILPKAGVST